MSSAIERFQKMVSDFQQANAAAIASATNGGEAGVEPPADAKAPGTVFAAISAANDDTEISDLEDGASNIASAAKELSATNQNGMESDGAKRAIKAQCTETRSRVDAIKASGDLEGNGPSSG